MRGFDRIAIVAPTLLFLAAMGCEHIHTAESLCDDMIGRSDECGAYPNDSARDAALGHCIEQARLFKEEYSACWDAYSSAVECGLGLDCDSLDEGMQWWDHGDCEEEEDAYVECAAANYSD